MRNRKSLRQLSNEEKPLVAIAAHDALTAKMITRAGFKSLAIGGSSMLAARYGLPDIGLAALEEMAAGARDIIAATDLPVIIDGDDGYGDIKNVSHTIHTYERIGVSGVVLEDQSRDHKQPGDDKAHGVITEDYMAAKIKAAVASREDKEMLIIARTDSYQLEGLTGALKRGEKYLAAGADGVFIPGVKTVEEIAKIGEAFMGTYQFIGLFETGKTPWLTPNELGSMGYKQVVFPAAIMLRVIKIIDSALTDLKNFVENKKPLLPFSEQSEARDIMQDVLCHKNWKKFEETYNYTGLETRNRKL